MSDLLVASNITLNLQRPNSNVVVYAKQYDMISRVVNASLVSGSEVWDPPAGCEIVVMYTKPDGKMGIYDVADGYPEYSNQNTYEIGDRVIYGGYIYSCRVAILVPEAWNANHWNYVSTATPAVSKTGTGQIQITLAEQALNVEGNVHVEISFYQSSTRLTTLSFTISVEKGVPNDDALKSDNYFNILSGMIQNLMGASSYPPQIDPTTRNWIVWNADRLPPGPEVTEYSSVGPQGTQGIQGNQGWSIVSVTKTGGTGAGGTVDTYTMRNNNPDASQQVVGTFNVYNGNDGNAAPGSAIPLTDNGAGVRGDANAYSREDHRHPLNVSDDDPEAVSSVPSAGVAETYSRSDHVHTYDLSTIFEAVFPIGYIYISATDSDPGDMFGGVWTRIKGRFLLAAADQGETAPDNTYYYNVAGNSGGEATHLLSSAESGQKAISNVGAHTHKFYWRRILHNGVTQTGGAAVLHNEGNTIDSSSSSISIAGSNASQAHNNVPPFLAVYMWQRIE